MMKGSLPEKLNLQLSNVEAFHYGTVPSTMEEAFALAKQYPTKTVLALADTQSAGRGRGGHTWESNVGNLFFTIGFQLENLPKDIAAFPLVVGLSIAEVLTSYGVKVNLKWPNDILAGTESKKLCGILVEAKKDRENTVLLVGVGLNIVKAPAEGTSLKELRGEDTDKIELLSKIVAKLCTNWDVFLGNGFTDFRTLWLNFAVWLNQKIQLNSAGTLEVGTFLGVDNSGALLLECEDGLKTIYSAEFVRKI